MRMERRILQKMVPPSVLRSLSNMLPLGGIESGYVTRGPSYRVDCYNSKRPESVIRKRGLRALLGNARSGKKSVRSYSRTTILDFEADQSVALGFLLEGNFRLLRAEERGMSLMSRFSALKLEGSPKLTGGILHRSEIPPW